MSPIGGVGINLAIQDAVAAANILAPGLRRGGAVDDAVLDQVQRRRELPTRITQRVQVLIQDRVISRVLAQHRPAVAAACASPVAPLARAAPPSRPPRRPRLPPRACAHARTCGRARTAAVMVDSAAREGPVRGCKSTFLRRPRDEALFEPRRHLWLMPCSLFLILRQAKDAWTVSRAQFEDRRIAS